MDPLTAVTAVANAIDAIATYQNNLFMALPADEKAKQAQQIAADQQAWRDFWKPLIALLPKAA